MLRVQNRPLINLFPYRWSFSADIRGYGIIKRRESGGSGGLRTGFLDRQVPVLQSPVMTPLPLKSLARPPTRRKPTIRNRCARVTGQQLISLLTSTSFPRYIYPPKNPSIFSNPNAFPSNRLQAIYPTHTLAHPAKHTPSIHAAKEKNPKNRTTSCP